MPLKSPEYTISVPEGEKLPEELAAMAGTHYDREKNEIRVNREQLRKMIQSGAISTDDVLDNAVKPKAIPVEGAAGSDQPSEQVEEGRKETNEEAQKAAPQPQQKPLQPQKPIPLEGAGAKKDKQEENSQSDAEPLDKVNMEREEMVPYSVAHKVGGMSISEVGYLESLFGKTRFLAIDDLWQMAKTMYEYYQRRWQRRQKDKYSHISKDLPFFGSEMQRVREAAQNEEVNQFKEAISSWGVYQIQERLQDTGNFDEMKACFITLSEKGEMRWDDISMWKNINRMLASHGDTKYRIPIPTKGDPYTMVDEETRKTGFDYLKNALDSMWGEGTYDEWFQKNKSTFESNAKAFHEEGKEMEGLDGGHTRRLAELLRQHKNGEYVNPHRYEGLVIHSILAGKSDIQSKIYYMVEGVAAKNEYGRTILSFDRMAHINSEMLNRFPILEYMCQPANRPDLPKGVSAPRPTMADYKKWIDIWEGDDRMNCEPNKNVDKFLWKYVIPSDLTQNRVNKALRNAQDLDHDDMHIYLPPATEQVLTNTCTNAGGQRKALTYEGYMNAYPGFNQYLKALTEEDNKYKLSEAIKSYVRFDAIMMGRWKKDDDKFARADFDMMNNSTIVSGEPPKQFQGEMKAALDRVIDAYASSVPGLKEKYDLCFTKTGNTKKYKEEEDKQVDVQFALETFGQAFTKAVQTDGGDKMRDIMATEAEKFTGLGFMSNAEKQRKKRQVEQKGEVDSEEDEIDL